MQESLAWGMLQVLAHRDSTLVAVTTRGVVDLRSDTLTQPTEAMRQAMASAPVGDDRYGEDPTVNRLEERFAELVGKPGAVYVPSGTMGNQIALRLHGTAGSNVVVGRRQHLMSYESGAAGLNNAFQIYAVDDAGGVVDTEAAAEAGSGRKRRILAPGIADLLGKHPSVLRWPGHRK